MDKGGEAPGALAPATGTVAAQLSSVATALAELTSRLSTIADSLARTANDELANGLFEVERSLTTAGRRLDKVVDELGAIEGPGPQRRRS
ncbi:MAG: hypothetical protein M3P53_12650 [Actinomycetota bacterium]|nr:hypothetical protein [Actinomycetota bacterium]